MEEFYAVLVTVPGEELGGKIARILVEEHLAACVQIVGPIRSIYRWKDKVEEDKEYLLIIKTTTTRYKALEERILSVHSYETPQIVALPIKDGYNNYLAWLGATVLQE